MSKIKTILLTGATDGIGLATARTLVAKGHRVLLHGRSKAKLKKVKQELSSLDAGEVESYVADLSSISDVEDFAGAVTSAHTHLDVLINNAGVFHTPKPVTPDGLDVRFVVNTFAPYLLTQRLLPLMDSSGRVVNLSSAAQSPVDTAALTGKRKLSDDFDAYAQSKLALTIWSQQLAKKLSAKGPVVIAVNPGSMLATKMVQQGFGVDGGDVGIGADVLVRAALAAEFSTASGKYFDNDARKFASPHADALDRRKSQKVVDAIEAVLAKLSAEQTT